MGRVIHAAFDDEAALRRGLERLGEAGVSADDVEVRSSIPLHDPEPLAGVEVRSRVPLLAILGGLLGGLTAFAVASSTALAYPIETGGMPIVALPPVAIITYEGTALGAILLTVGAVFFESRLLRRNGFGESPLDHYVAEGGVLVLVRFEKDEDCEVVRGALAGAVETAEG